MRGTALATVAVMITVYAAILIWALPHIAGRYTPKLNVIFLRRVTLIPFTLLLLFLLVAGFLMLPPLPHLFLAFVTFGRLTSFSLGGDILSFTLLVLSVLLVLFSGYRITQLFANDVQFISWFQGKFSRREALQEMLLNAVQRADHQFAASVLRAALIDQQSMCVSFVNWLMDHADLLSTDWLTRELLHLLSISGLDEGAAHLYGNLLRLLLTKALDDEIFARVRLILASILDMLASLSTWTKPHADLLYQMGFLIWNVGEEEAYAPRTARIFRQLTDTQALFMQGIHAIWVQIQKGGNANNVEIFAESLSQLTVKTLYLDGLLHAVTEYRFRHQLLTSQKVEEFSVSLREIMRGVMVDSCQEGVRNRVREQVSHLFLDLAVMLIELGEEKEVIASFLTNTHTGNVSALIRSAVITRQSQHDWLKPESYHTIAVLFGVPIV